MCGVGHACWYVILHASMHICLPCPQEHHARQKLDFFLAVNGTKRHLLETVPACWAAHIQLNIVEEKYGGERGGGANDGDSRSRTVYPLLKLGEQATSYEGPQKDADHLHVATHNDCQPLCRSCNGSPSYLVGCNLFTCN